MVIRQTWTHRRRFKPDNSKVIGELDRILDERKTADKGSSYVSSPYYKGLNKILEKVGEETTEAIIFAKELQLVRATGDNDEHAKADVVYEVADMWFHGLVALHDWGCRAMMSWSNWQDDLGCRALMRKMHARQKGKISSFCQNFMLD